MDHCDFTPAEVITALQTLVRRLDTGRWDVPSPAGLDGVAAALGDALDRDQGSPASPAFVAFRPAAFLRAAS